MIILTNSNSQTLAPGQSLTFDTIVMHTGCAEGYILGTNPVSLRMGRAIYDIRFSANIGATAPGEAQLSISSNGTPLPETIMISTTAAAGDLNNVSKETAIRTAAHCCKCADPEYCTVTNTGTTTIEIGENPLLFIGRLA